MSTKPNWSHVAAPPQSNQTHPRPSQPHDQPSTQSQSTSNRTRNRRQRRKRQKEQQETSKSDQWPSLQNKSNANGTLHTTHPKESQPRHNNKNEQPSAVSFASLTAQSQHFAPTSNPFDAISMSSAASSSAQQTQASTHSNVHYFHDPVGDEEELHRKEQQRQSALHTLKQQYMNYDSMDILSQSVPIYGVQNRGITNRRVDCYINAIIQSLLSLPLMVTIFSSIKNAKTASHIGPTTRALFDVFHLFSIVPHEQSTKNGDAKHSKRSKNGKHVDHNHNHTNYATARHPSSLVKILDKFRRSIGRQGNGQQDAQEFLGDVIATLHDEMTWDKDGAHTHSTCSPVKNQKRIRRRSENENDDETKDEHKEEQNGWTLVSKNVHQKTSVAHKLKMYDSLIAMLFGGEYYQMIRYRDNKRLKPSVSYTPFFMISLDINEYTINSVSAALQHHFSNPEEIDYKKRKALKSYLISESPYYLILHLKRFLYNMETVRYEKLAKYISYDTKLSVPPHLLFDKSVKKAGGNLKKLKYELRTVIVHSGDYSTHGHYVSYCRREDFYANKANKNRNHQWLMFNDNKVEADVDVNTVKSQQAYVLIYQKVL